MEGSERESESDLESEYEDEADENDQILSFRKSEIDADDEEEEFEVRLCHHKSMHCCIFFFFFISLQGDLGLGSEVKRGTTGYSQLSESTL